METSKACTKCRVEKPLEQFHRYHRGRLGRQSECKSCSKIRCADFVQRTGYRAKEWARIKANDPDFSIRRRQKFQQANPKLAWAWNATNRARQRAKTLGMEFNLTSEYVASIAPDLCPVFSLPMEYPDGSLRRGMTQGPQLFSASLDRITPSRGYVIGNVAVICHKANRIKADASLAEIEAVAVWLRMTGI